MTSASALAPLADRARLALATSTPCRSRFVLAGTTIELVGAGPSLAERIAPAFAHLASAVTGVDADLTVLLFDSASTGTALPDLLDAGVAVGDVVQPILHDEGRSFVFHAYEGAVSYLDLERRLAVFAVEDAERLPPWERACPLRAILRWWFEAHDQLLVHGAAVTCGDDAVLLAGVGGSGKSTTALACLAAGWGYLGDDYVLVDARSEPTVWSVYGSAKLAPEHLARFPGLLEPDPPRPHDPPDAKAVGWPLRSRPAADVGRAPISAIGLPTVRGSGRSSLAPVAASRALLALGPPTVVQTPGDSHRVMALAADLARSVPAYRLELGADLPAVPSLLESLVPAKLAR